MHNIKKYVTQFKREFHIRSSPTLNDLENIIVHRLFYKLIPYQGNEYLFCSLVRNPDIKCRTAVAIRSGEQRYVFYNDNIPYQDRLHIFAHEIAHIYINHYSRDDGYTDTPYRKEREANEFAVLLLQKPKKRIGIFAVCVSIILLLTFSFFSPQFIDVDIIITPNDTTVNQHADPLYSKSSKEEVIITQTGSKYHKENCSHLKKRTNFRTVSINDATEYGFSPCLDCFQ